MFNPDRLQACGIRLESNTPIGRGTQGKVYDAMRLTRGGQAAMPCVVKIYEHVDDRKRLIEEINSLAKLCDSDYIVNLIDIVEIDDSVALVLEKCGRSFAQLLIEHQQAHPGTGLPRSEAYRLCETIAKGLAHCRADNVIHGDVKPDNMLLSLRGGSAKLTDFGTARLDQSATKLTSHGGTLAYMLPRHDEGELTRERDLFGLAVSYAELRLGRHPYQSCKPHTGKFDLIGLDEDEIQFLQPILAGVPIPELDPEQWFRMLDPRRNSPQTQPATTPTRNKPAGSSTGKTAAPGDKLSKKQCFAIRVAYFCFGPWGPPVHFASLRELTDQLQVRSSKLFEAVPPDEMAALSDYLARFLKSKPHLSNGDFSADHWRKYAEQFWKELDNRAEELKRNNCKSAAILKQFANQLSRQLHAESDQSLLVEASAVPPAIGELQSAHPTVAPIDSSTRKLSEKQKLTIRLAYFCTPISAQPPNLVAICNETKKLQLHNSQLYEAVPLDESKYLTDFLQSEKILKNGNFSSKRWCKHAQLFKNYLYKKLNNLTKYGDVPEKKELTRTITQLNKKLSARFNNHLWSKTSPFNLT